MGILGSWETNTYTLTDDESTSEAIDIRGRAMVTVRNRSGSSITFDIYEKSEPDDTPNLYEDGDGLTKEGIVVANGRTRALYVYDIAILVLKLSDGSEDANVKVHIER